MPPGPAYNFLCVLSSAVNILSHAARIRAAQITVSEAALTSTKRKRQKIGPDHVDKSAENDEASSSSSSVVPDRGDAIRKIVESGNTNSSAYPVEITYSPPKVRYKCPEASSRNEPLERSISSNVNQLDQEIATPHEPLTSEKSTFIPEIDITPRISLPKSTVIRNLQSSKVPSSRIGRLFHYGGLAASLGYGAASEIVLRSTSSAEQGEQPSSLMMTEANINRLVSKLSQMRGAALKLGQFMSIQDTHLLPPEIDKIFRRVQDGAHYMPDWQMEQVLTTSLGTTYSSHFTSFNRIPFAAASIGQVHNAVLSASSSPTGKEEVVAVKIQFPNIVSSIESDLGYVKMLLTMGRLLPKGLFLDRTIQVMKGELADECDYTREASYLTKFRSPAFLGNDFRYKVPWVWEGSTDTVLVMEHVDGISVGEGVVGGLSQADRDYIATRIIELCLKELFEFRAMQTDPNWTNFLWNAKTRQIELVDFGATREYSKDFIDDWFRLLQAGAAGNREACVDWSLKLGYLTGEENDTMLNAHITSMILLATPFRASTPQPVAFGPGTTWAGTTAEIRGLIPVMLKNRLTPPPKETYSLNRKLSGAFLLASRLGARVDTKSLWDEVVENYRFGL